MPQSSARRPISTRWMTVFVIGVILAIWVLAIPASVFGSEVRQGNDVSVRANEQISEDLYITGGDVAVDGSAARDVIVAAGRYEQSGRIEGSLSIAAGEATIAGSIEGSLRVIGGDVVVRADVGGDVIILGGTVDIESQASIGGSLILTGGQATVRGDVEGDIRGYASSATLGGIVGGNVDVTVSDLVLESATEIGGDFRYVSGQNADIDGRARIAGTTERVDLVPWQGLYEDAGPFGVLARLLRSLLTGAAIVLALPVVAGAWVRSGRRPVAAVIAGIVGLTAVPVLALVALVSSIGSGIGWVITLAILAALYLSQVAAGLAIGQWLMPRRWSDGSRGFALLAMTVGVLMLVGLRLIPVPYVGQVVAVLATVFGFGVIGLSLLRLTRTERPAVL